jgi:hypothetical protein
MMALNVSISMNASPTMVGATLWSYVPTILVLYLFVARVLLVTMVQAIHHAKILTNVPFLLLTEVVTHWCPV